MKIQCLICGFIYEGEKSLEGLEECPSCHANKNNLKEFPSESILKNAVLIGEDNPGVIRDYSVCIDCGICKNTCKESTGLDFGADMSKCLSCGQCILTCPTGALKPRSSLDEVKNALALKKTLICYTSPAVRVSIGEAFGYEAGTFMKEQLIGLLRVLGFDIVLDTTFGADLTIMEEAKEFQDRIHKQKGLPMFTSCCPSWVKYVEENYPSLGDHLSSTKSPIAMEGEMVKQYYAKKRGIEKEDIFTVAITPCTAKKMEIKKEEIEGTDAVLTISEIISWAKQEKIDFSKIEKSDFDSIFKEGSGGGTLFGTSGGVMESLLRTFYFLETGSSLPMSLDLKPIRGMNEIKELEIPIHDWKLKVLILYSLKNAKPFLESIQKGNSPYHFIEVMNCKGGCIGGGGQPKHLNEQTTSLLEKRMKGLYERDAIVDTHSSYENEDIKRIYEEYLGAPSSAIAKAHLHRNYEKQKEEIMS